MAEKLFLSDFSVKKSGGWVGRRARAVQSATLWTLHYGLLALVTLSKAGAGSATNRSNRSRATSPAFFQGGDNLHHR